ncbi:hypothetical protein RHGRI_008123 [Rhododendron griersonianum]|uniref:Uncharacterized protein n=1 Tax=Rhododendron griersonianum TaxID=479676 RepID=A0AAV6L2D2_9ERIC|nr:hypothetical protein RHGRI_008123 [Rhododendron griersonianum]
MVKEWKEGEGLLLKRMEEREDSVAEKRWVKRLKTSIWWMSFGLGSFALNGDDLFMARKKTLQLQPNVRGNAEIPISDEKFLSRLSSKKMISSHSKQLAEPSFRVLYYGGSSGSVPFTWESQPGTPKHPVLTSGPHSSRLPPLTPPPSYRFPSSPKTNAVPKKGPKPNLLFAIFPKLFPSRKNHVPPPPLSSSSVSSSCSSGSYSSASTLKNPRSWFSFPRRSNVCFRVDEEDHDIELRSSTGSPASTLWFGAS